MNYPSMNEAGARFLREVEAGTIELFGHREHLRLAFLAAQASDSLDGTIARCRNGIRAVATAKGAPDTYDEGLTAAWARRIRDAVARLPDASFDELLARQPELLGRE